MPEAPTFTAVLSLRLPLTDNVPASIRVGPLYVFDPLNVKVPAPFFVKAPEPEIVLLRLTFKPVSISTAPPPLFRTIGTEGTEAETENFAAPPLKFNAFVEPSDPVSDS